MFPWEMVLPVPLILLFLKLILCFLFLPTRNKSPWEWPSLATTLSSWGWTGYKLMILPSIGKAILSPLIPNTAIHLVFNLFLLLFMQMILFLKKPLSLRRISVFNLFSSLNFHDLPEPALDDFRVCQLALEYINSKSDSFPHQLNSLTLHQDPAEQAPLVTLPEQYCDFSALLEDKELGTLPPWCPFDNAINLEPGSQAPFGPLYTLSEKEPSVLCNYIKESLAKGFICYSESPAGVPVLFVPKKNGDLHLCVDYHAVMN